MATVNIGNLTFTHKGDYASGTAYVKNDVVYYSTNGNAYIAKQGTTGNAPTNATYWNQFAAGSGGIWNAGLSLGSAEQVVKVNSGGNALEFGTISSTDNFQSVVASNRQQFTSTTRQQWVDITPLTLTITPSATNSKILIMARINASINNGGSTHHYIWNGRILRNIGGGAFATPTGSANNVGNGAWLGNTRAEYDDNSVGQNLGFCIDSPNTTSACIYKLQFYSTTSSGTFKLNDSTDSGLNSNHYSFGTSELIALEIKQ